MFSRPFDRLQVLGVNALLACLGWFLLPPGLRSLVFTLHGRFAFPLVLASWMLCDTVATNLLGTQPDQARRLLITAERARSWLVARCLVLGLVVGVPSAVVLLILAKWQHPVTIAVVSLLLLVLPLGILPWAACIGIQWPYHPRALRWRWQTRRQILAIVRWLALVAAPFLAVPAIGVVVIAPPILIVWAVTGDRPTRFTPAELAVTALVTLVAVAIHFAFGISTAIRLFVHRRDRLLNYLGNPAMG